MAAVRDPATLPSLDAAQWEELLRQGRRQRLLARLAIQLEERELLNRIPEKAREQLIGARLYAEFNQTEIRHEIHRVLRALDGIGGPVVLLKGAAYMMASLPPSRGRVSADVDILVPAESLTAVEKALLTHGWEGAELDAYDQHYYRVWAHEIPPLVHPDRGTEVDVHHTVVPRTSRATPDVTAMLEAAVPLEDRRLAILLPPDMVVHSAVHLFHEAFEAGLRELLDLHDLLCHFGARAGFWEGLVPRARRHGLERTLYYALRYTEQVLGTPVPPAIREEAKAGAPSLPVRVQMDWLVPAAMIPDTPERKRRASRVARWLLYVRSHWLRMPPMLLAYHLSMKTWRRARDWLRAGPVGSVE